MEYYAFSFVVGVVFVTTVVSNGRLFHNVYSQVSIRSLTPGGGGYSL